MEGLIYKATRTTRTGKVGMALLSTFLLGLAVWASFGDATMKLEAVSLVLLVAGVVGETFVEQLVFTEWGLLYTNQFGRKRRVPYSDIQSLRYIVGSELRMNVSTGRRIQVSYGDFARMITIIGDKTGRRPPLEILDLPESIKRLFGVADEKKTRNKPQNEPRSDKR